MHADSRGWIVVRRSDGQVYSSHPTKTAAEASRKSWGRYRGLYAIMRAGE